MDILHAPAYSILPSIAGGLGFSFISFYDLIIAFLCDKIVFNPLTIIEKEAGPR